MNKLSLYFILIVLSACVQPDYYFKKDQYLNGFNLTIENLKRNPSPKKEAIYKKYLDIYFETMLNKIRNQSDDGDHKIVKWNGILSERLTTAKPYLGQKYELYHKRLLFEYDAYVQRHLSKIDHSFRSALQVFQEDGDKFTIRCLANKNKDLIRLASAMEHSIYPKLKSYLDYCYSSLQIDIKSEERSKDISWLLQNMDFYNKKHPYLKIDFMEDYLFNEDRTMIITLDQFRFYSKKLTRTFEYEEEEESCETVTLEDGTTKEITVTEYVTKRDCETYFKQNFKIEFEVSINCNYGCSGIENYTSEVSFIRESDDNSYNKSRMRKKLIKSLFGKIRRKYFNRL